MNHKPARRFGGKGTPRLPPKGKSIPPPDVQLTALTKGFTPINSTMAFINTESEMRIFEKPDIKIFKTQNKPPVAYVLTGKYTLQKIVDQATTLEKNVELKDEKDNLVLDDEKETVMSVTESELKYIDKMLDEEIVLKQALMDDYERRKNDMSYTDGDNGEVHENEFIEGILNGYREDRNYASNNGNGSLHSKKQGTEQKGVDSEENDKYEINKNNGYGDKLGEVTEIEGIELTNKKIKELTGNKGLIKMKEYKETMEIEDEMQEDMDEESRSTENNE